LTRCSNRQTNAPLRRPVESALRSTIAVMHAAGRRLSRVDGRAQGGQRQPDVDRAADGITDDPARPGVEDDGNVDEARGDRDVGDVGHPEPVRPIRHDILRQVREDGQFVIAIGGGDIAPAPARLKTMFAHQASDFLMIDDKAAVPQRCLHPAVAIGLEAVGDRRHRLDERRVVDADGRLVVIGRARDPHQPTSFCDGDAEGPMMTDVVALLGRGPCFRAPFRNSISSACRPTSRSSAAMRAS
jgi:hypothetical protein